MTAAQLGLSATQYANGLGIIAAVKQRGWAPKAAYIAVETALTESGMRMIASANVPASQNFPHELLDWTDDGLGHDHASMGMFQQQTGYRWTPAGFGSDMDQTTIDSPDGWGTPTQLMDARTSTSVFLDSLASVDWAHLDNWVAAQAVQRSSFADGSNYRQQDARARRIVDALWQAAGTPAALPQEDEMRLITRDDPAPELSLLLDGTDVWLLQNGDRDDYLAAGIAAVAIPAAHYDRLRSRSQPLHGAG